MVATDRQTNRQTDYRQLLSHSPWRKIRQGQKWLYDDVITWDLSSIPPLTIICSKILIFPSFFTKASPTHGPTDRWTDGRTDRPSHRDARTHLKRAENAYHRKRSAWPSHRADHAQTRLNPNNPLRIVDHFHFQVRANRSFFHSNVWAGEISSR